MVLGYDAERQSLALPWGEEVASVGGDALRARCRGSPLAAPGSCDDGLVRGYAATCAGCRARVIAACERVTTVEQVCREQVRGPRPTGWWRVS